MLKLKDFMNMTDCRDNVIVGVEDEYILYPQLPKVYENDIVQTFTTSGRNVYVFLKGDNGKRKLQATQALNEIDRALTYHTGHVHEDNLTLLRDIIEEM